MLYFFVLFVLAVSLLLWVQSMDIECERPAKVRRVRKTAKASFAHPAGALRQNS